MSLLQIIQTQVHETYPEADAWLASIPGLEQACTEDLSSIKLDMERIEEGMNDLAKNLAAIKAASTSKNDADNSACPFVKCVMQFEQQTAEYVKGLREQQKDLNTAMRTMAETFGEEVDNAPWILRTLNTFAKQYTKVQEDNQRLTEQMK